MTENYGYDNIYQLLSVLQGATTTESYTYDKVGNRLSNVSGATYTVNNSNQLTSISGSPGTTFTYDNNGNTTTKVDASGTTTYTWNSENQLKQVSLPGGATVTFKYDPFGRRVQKVSASGTVNYLYDGMDAGANVIQEVGSGANVLSRYVQSPAIDEPLVEVRSATTSYYQPDGLGSITALSDSSGAVTDTFNYRSFGTLAAMTGSGSNPFRYTGREFDADSNVYYYRLRYLDQSIGKFLSEDPSGFSGGINFYRYVNNSPIGNVDPLGLATCTFFVSQGTLWCWPEQPGHEGVFINVASGNNGGGMNCKNNPSCAALKDRGPIPKGWWKWTTDPTTKPNGRVLVPMPGTMTWGRDLIRSHSCANAFGPSVSSPFCSTGCVTGSADDIRRLNKLIDSEPNSKMKVVD